MTPPRTGRSASAAKLVRTCPAPTTDVQAVAPLWVAQAAPDVQYLLLHDLWTPSTLDYYEDQLERLKNCGVEAGLRNAPNVAAVSELNTQRTQLEQVVTFLRTRTSQIHDERFDVALLDATTIETIQLLMSLEERRLAQFKQLKKTGSGRGLTKGRDRTASMDQGSSAKVRERTVSMDQGERAFIASGAPPLLRSQSSTRDLPQKPPLVKSSTGTELSAPHCKPS